MRFAISTAHRVSVHAESPPEMEMTDAIALTPAGVPSNLREVLASASLPAPACSAMT
jgi:hypothetical protein